MTRCVMGRVRGELDLGECRQLIQSRLELARRMPFRPGPSRRGMVRLQEPEVEKAVEALSQLSGGKGLGVRHLQAVVLFGALTITYILRMNLSVAVVQMENSKTNRVEMDSTERALLLSSFFFGYGILQVPLGNLGRRGYSTRLIAISLFASGALSVTLPLSVQVLKVPGACALRFISGLFQGAIYPNVYTLISKWAVPKEKDLVACLVWTGASVGSLFASVVSGYLGYHYDWPAIFYITGVIGIIWGLMQVLVGSQSPQECTYISKEEREFIELSFKAHCGKESPSIPPTVPWRSILTSGPVFAVLLTMWCSGWSSWTILTLTPSYISGVLGFDLKDDGLLSSLPQLSACLTGLSISYIASYFKKITSFDDNFLRKMWNSLGHYGAGLCMLLLAYLPVDATGAVTLLVVASAVQMLQMAGNSLALLDLSPNFSGIIMAITNATANTASIAGPLISTFLIKDTSNREQWRIVFLVAAALYFLGNTIFIIWGSSERQPWDQPEESTEPDTPS